MAIPPPFTAFPGPPPTKEVETPASHVRLRRKNNVLNENLQTEIESLRTRASVTSFNGRPGTVVPASGDYNATQVNMAASSRVLGRTTAGAGAVEELTGSAVTGLLDPASTTTRGVVEIATDAETQTGTDATRAVSPAGGSATWVKKDVLTTSGDLLTASGPGVPARLEVGSEGQVLSVVGGVPTWVTLSVAAMPTLAVSADVWRMFADIGFECLVDLAVSGSLSVVS